jgi:hypothetical protein
MWHAFRVEGIDLNGSRPERETTFTLAPGIYI